MAVGHETLLPPTLQARFGKKAGRRRHRKDVNRGVALHKPGEIDRLLVHDDEIDLRMRHAAGLDRILDRSLLPQLPLDHRCAASWPNEKREVAVKMKDNPEAFASSHGAHGLSELR